MQICKEYHSKVYKLEGDKWDLERGIKIRILEVQSPPNLQLDLNLGMFSLSRFRSDLNFETHCLKIGGLKEVESQVESFRQKIKPPSILSCSFHADCISSLNFSRCTEANLQRVL